MRHNQNTNIMTAQEARRMKKSAFYTVMTATILIYAIAFIIADPFGRMLLTIGAAICTIIVSWIWFQ